MVLLIIIYRTNNLYHNVFYSIMSKIFEVAPEKLLITILFKLNLLANLSKIMNEVCINDVLLLEKHIDSAIYYIRLLADQIKAVTKVLYYIYNEHNYPFFLE